MNRDLFLAILSMDSYNRGYAQSVSGLGVIYGRSRIGNATIISDKGDAAAIAAGFYAIAYTVTGVDGIADGSTVIAYRGTDKVGGLDGDLLNGWTLGGNLPHQSQGALAIEFYNAVVRGIDGTARRTVYDIGGSRPIVTGHSLGGGLAGFVGTLSGGTMVGFDHMPFLAATLAAFITEFRKRAADHQDAVDATPTDALLARYGMQRPDFVGWTGIAVQGEVNRLLRDGTIATVIGGELRCQFTKYTNCVMPNYGASVLNTFIFPSAWELR